MGRKQKTDCDSKEKKICNCKPSCQKLLLLCQQQQHKAKVEEVWKDSQSQGKPMVWDDLDEEGSQSISAYQDPDQGDIIDRDEDSIIDKEENRGGDEEEDSDRKTADGEEMSNGQRTGQENDSSEDEELGSSAGGVGMDKDKARDNGNEHLLGNDALQEYWAGQEGTDEDESKASNNPMEASFQWGDNNHLIGNNVFEDYWAAQFQDTVDDGEEGLMQEEEEQLASWEQYDQDMEGDNEEELSDEEILKELDDIETKSGYTAEIWDMSEHLP